ncbi:unnamed protein product [Protopolystoma xenopodis]|uniref:Uncharacterized protein n=1 Tax=Protopolystoma xenopodis TaxID=117903 RepID=A0A448WLN8_9PLAT|nr:unnamed protein product [Protopolystoma xenopodis]
MSIWPDLEVLDPKDPFAGRPNVFSSSFCPSPDSKKASSTEEDADEEEGPEYIEANRQLVKRNPPSSLGGTELRISSPNTFTRNGNNRGDYSTGRRILDESEKLVKASFLLEQDGSVACA